jgi:hypothetical protein
MSSGAFKFFLLYVLRDFLSSLVTSWSTCLAVLPTLQGSNAEAVFISSSDVIFVLSSTAKLRDRAMDSCFAGIGVAFFSSSLAAAYFLGPHMILRSWGMLTYLDRFLI